MAKVIDISKKLLWHPTRRWAKRSLANIDTIVVHCTASANQDPYKTNSYHITPGKDNHLSTKGAPHLAYHFFINDTGTIYKCNDLEDSTWHAGLYNTRSVGIVMAYEGKKDILPPTEQYQALKEELVALCLNLHIFPNRILGHREVPGMFVLLGNGSKKFRKECPGMAVNLDSLRLDITLRMQTVLASKGLYAGPIDGIFGKMSKLGLSQYPSESM